MCSFTGMGRITGMDPICGFLVLFIYSIRAEWPQKVINPIKMQFRYRKNGLYGGVV